jgi:hypothetical protein
MNNGIQERLKSRLRHTHASPVRSPERCVGVAKPGSSRQVFVSA